MHGVLRPLTNTQGAALVTAMLMIAGLTAMGLLSLNTTVVNQEIAGQLKAAKQAFYQADAAIQWGKALVRNSPAIPPVDVPSTFTRTLDGGTQTLTFTSQHPTSPATRYAVAVRAIGSLGTATRTIDALLTKTYDVGDAPIALRGVDANSGFTGNAFEIDGRDYAYNPETASWEATGTTGLGVSVPDATLQAQVTSALSAQQQDNIIGQGGPPSVGISDAFPSDAIAQLADALCAATPPGSQTTIPLSNTVSMSGTTTWGTRGAPQIHCITGSGTASQPAKLDIGGTFSGVGIVVVRDAQLIASGAFHFEGLILNSGSHVGVNLIGGGNKELFGSVMINERTGDTQLEIDVTGAVQFRASRSALATASQLFSSQAWQILLPVAPTDVQERSWREVHQ